MFLIQKNTLPPLNKTADRHFKTIYHLFCCIYIIFSCEICASNIKNFRIDMITDILPYIEQADILITDFDDTLFKSASMLATGSKAAKTFLQKHLPSQTFENDYQNLLIYGSLNSENILQKINEQGEQMYILLEEEWKNIFFSLENYQIPSLILTSRQDNDPYFWEMLKSCAWKDSFQMSSFPLKHLSKPAFLPVGYEFKPIYNNSVIFTDLADKGEALEIVSSYLFPEASKILYIDNDERHCLSVSKFLEKYNNTGWVFYYEAVEKQFDEQKALTALIHLKKTGILLKDNIL